MNIQMAMQGKVGEKLNLDMKYNTQATFDFDNAMKLNYNSDKFSEDEIDTYILPHPLLGKLTIREMIYFTIYHVEHHQNNTKQNLV